MSDLISRQSAIEALENDKAALDKIIKGMSAMDVRLDAYVSQRNQVNCDIDTISNLPPAQPEPCEDAVSRESVRSMTCNHCGRIDCEGEADCVRMMDVQDLPPVKPA